jgi:hypothetical protein
MRMENHQTQGVIHLTNMGGTDVINAKTEQALPQGCNSVHPKENNDNVNHVEANLNKAVKVNKTVSSKHRPPMLTNFRRTFIESNSPVPEAMEKSAG